MPERHNLLASRGVVHNLHTGGLHSLQARELGAEVQ